MNSPDPKIHTGNLTALPGKVYDFTEITGYIEASGADTKTAFPKLTTVGGSIYAGGANTKTAFPKLTTVGGFIDASGADTKTAFPKLTTVGGFIYARGADTKTAFPKLTTVGGAIDARGADTKTAFPKLTTVGGSIYAGGANTKTAFPKLTTVGGYIYASGADTKTAFPKLVSTNKTDAIHAALGAQNLILADGILAKVVSKRGPVMRVIVIGRNKVSYIVTRDGRTAHGGTLAEARADLLVKIGNRDTSPYRSWTAGTKATLEDMIVAYRVITGACAQGVSFFLAETKCPKELTVGCAVELTQGRYGHQAFRNFFAAK